MITTTPIMQKAQDTIEKMCVKKSAFTTTDLASGGLLAPQQYERFIALVKFKPNLLRHVRVVMMDGPTQRIDRITFASRILHAATEGSSLSASNQAKPTTSKLELNAKSFKAEVQLTYESLQDSIEGGRQVRGNSFENRVFQLMFGEIARNLEEIALLSDTTSSTTDYAQFDGWIKDAQDTNSYNHGGSAVGKSFFKKTLLTIPKQYRQNKSELIFVVSPNMDVEWTDELGDRVTVTGDAAVWGAKEVKGAYGIPFVVSGYMPEESGTSSNLGKVLLTHPKNMVLGIWRNVYLEVDRDIRSGVLIVVASLRIDVTYEQVEGASVGYNVKVV